MIKLFSLTAAAAAFIAFAPSVQAQEPRPGCQLPAVACGGAGSIAEGAPPAAPGGLPNADMSRGGKGVRAEGAPPEAPGGSPAE